jgi:glycosyltransferase involved in cell wall biosynthesis
MDHATDAATLRDAGDWQGAASAYARHLAAHPEDWPGWVQHGHCVKEAGDPDAALASYRRAELGLGGDADLQVQIGHALKRLGDPAGARAAFARALELDPLSDTAWREVVGLLGGAAPEAGLALLDDLRIVFDVSDLWSWYGSARAPSGIQRIQVEVARAVLARDAMLAEARLAVFRPESASWHEMPREAFWRLAGLSAAAADAFDATWMETRAQVAALLDAAPPLRFAAGSWLVNVGSSWWLPGYHAAVRDARLREGLRHAALVHDVGPVVVPEHSEPAVSASFARWVAALAVSADLVLCVSEATRAELAALWAETLPGVTPPPLQVLRPGHALPPAAGPPHPRAASLAPGGYVLAVGTIESRKDHLFLLNAWLGLLRRHGAALPPLVLVGRAGFESGPVLELLRRAPAFEGRVLWLDDVADGALAALLRDAGFALYNSRHEGWGLPVTEALAAGKVVVAPAIPALVEAGGGLALHFAPGSAPDFSAVVERLLFEDGYRDAVARRVGAEFRPRAWRRMAADLVEALQQAPAEAVPAPPAPPLGTVLSLADIPGTRPRLAMAWGEALRAGGGWHPPEAWGCWTRPGRALLRLALPADTRGPLRLHVALRGATEARSVTLRVGRGARAAMEVPADARPVAALEIDAPGAAIELAIECAGADVGIGVVAAMACAPGDVEARLGLLERLAFVWPEVR